MLVKDLVYAGRTLRKSPAFTLTAVVTIALGIGSSTAIFSVMNAVLLRPLPYANADRLVVVWGDLKNRNVHDWPFSGPDYYDLRKEATFFDDLAGVSTGRQPLTGDDGEPEQVRVAGVTPNFFGLLGGRVALGRDFEEKDALPQPRAAPPAPGNAPRLPAIAILSHGIWQRRYGGDPRIIGRNIDLGGGRAQVIGVLAPGFELLFAPSTSVERLPDIWTAMCIDYQNSSRNNVFLRVIGRLKSGVSLERAQVQVDGIASELRKGFPIKETAGLHFRLEPMHADLVKDVRPTILALMGAVIFLLLIACANVANLLLVRVSRRERELAVRAALGGSRWRLVRQMLAESLLLASAGGLLGITLARLGIELLIALGPEDVPRIDSIAVNAGVLAFSALAGLAAAAIFGVVPAVRASRPDLVEILRAAGRTGGLSAGSLLRKAVVIAEVALSFVLLVGSGLMLRSLVALQRTDPGFDARGILTFTISGLRGQGPQRAAIIQQLRERLRGVPECSPSARPRRFLSMGKSPMGDGARKRRGPTRGSFNRPTSTSFCRATSKRSRLRY